MSVPSFELKTPLQQPRTIMAKIFVKDPLFANEKSNGIAQVKVPGEAWIGAGPTSARFKVVDHGPGIKTPAVRVLVDGTGFDIGRTAPVHNLKFHQVNVWAIMCKCLEHLESASVFGRRIPWAFPHGRLRIRPHALIDENAFYDRGMGGIDFGFFDDSKGKTIYTCLSHDVVTHEFGHAVLDGLKPLYNEVTNADTAGFHEYFGDAIAMTSALTQRDVVVRAVGKGPATLRGSAIISHIAEEFGSAIGRQPFLRTAANRMTMAKLAGNFEEHDRSLVLTGAFHDILTKIYPLEHKRQIAKVDRRKAGQKAVAALINSANYTSRMMLRGLDYCVPVGLTYRDYARAVIRADEVAYPIDANGYRQIAKDVFCKRGIVDSLEDLQSPTLPNDALRAFDIERLADSPTDAYSFVDQNRRTLGIPPLVELTIGRVYVTKKVAAGGYFPPRETVIEFHWQKSVRLDKATFGKLGGTIYPLYGGGTLVFDHNGNLLHYVLADTSDARRSSLLEYLKYLQDNDYLDTPDGMRARGVDAVRIEADVIDGQLKLRRNSALRGCHCRRQ